MEFYIFNNHVAGFRFTRLLGFILISIVFRTCNSMICLEQSSNEKEPVIWPNSLVSLRKITSNPLCLTKSQELVTRMCTPTGWIPSHENMPNCYETQPKPHPQQCPPSYSSILDNTGRIKFCYYLTAAKSWDYPCKNSGSSMTLLDLSIDDLTTLANRLKFTERKLVWFPARRITSYGPIVSTVIGKRWGDVLEFGHNVKLNKLPVTQSCLLYDLDKFYVKTDNCSYKYPSICISNTEHLLNLHCDKGYKATKYGLHEGRCFGNEIVDEEITWQTFKEEKCSQPLQILSPIENQIFQDLRKNQFDSSEDHSCFIGLVKNSSKYSWYPNKETPFVNWNPQVEFGDMDDEMYGAIEDKFTWNLVDVEEKLKCMACQQQPEIIIPEMILQSSTDQETLLLTIYFPNSLWKEDDEIGVHCFTNTLGFVTKLGIASEKQRKIKYSLRNLQGDDNSTQIKTSEVEKTTITIDRINDEAGEYWCQGHSSINFTFINSNYVLLSSKKFEEHIFSLRVKVKNICPDISSCSPYWNEITSTVIKLLKIKNATLMSVLDIDINNIAEMIFHLDVKLIITDTCISTCSVTKTFRLLQELSETVFNSQSNITFIQLKSSMYCMPIENDDEFALHWEITPIGGNTVTKELCMQPNGLPVTRKCSGSFLMGGSWDNVEGYCSGRYEATNKTTYLYSISRGCSDSDTVSDFLSFGLKTILNDTQSLIPADIYFMSVSLKVVVEMSNTNSNVVNLGDTNNIATAVDSFMNVNEDFINLAQTMNSSNMILDSLDIILSKIALNESGVSVFDENGVDRSVTSQYIIQISEPSLSNVTGMAIIRKPGIVPLSFMDFNIIPLYANTSLLNVLSIQDLEAATWVTEEILNKINRVGNTTANVTETSPLKIIISVYYNDVIFQETNLIKDKVNSRVLSVIIPGYESDLLAPLPIVYRRFNGSSSAQRECAHWDFNAANQFSNGKWSQSGCFSFLNSAELDVCVCFHLTHFAQLVLGNKGSSTPEENLINNYHGRALNAITIVGCTLSLLGIIGIFTTALVFRSWRQKPGTKVLLQLSAAIALQYLNMLLQGFLNDSSFTCVMFGAILHYSVLTSFTWMLLTALLQFARYVKVLGVQRPARFMMKFSIVGWGFPILPVVVLLLVDYSAYIPYSMQDVLEISNRSQAGGALCYPKGLSLYLTVLLPIACIVITNCVVFILVIRSIMISSAIKSRQTDTELIASQLRLSVLLFFLLGLSWIFGLLAVTGNEILFSYLFCLTATIQGFVLFIYFVVCDPATRVLWVSLVRERSKSLSRENSGT